jgi:hypothetical protein
MIGDGWEEEGDGKEGEEGEKRTCRWLRSFSGWRRQAGCVGVGLLECGSGTGGRMKEVNGGRSLAAGAPSEAAGVVERGGTLAGDLLYLMRVSWGRKAREEQVLLEKKKAE